MQALAPSPCRVRALADRVRRAVAPRARRSPRARPTRRARRCRRRCRRGRPRASRRRPRGRSPRSPGSPASRRGSTATGAAGGTSSRARVTTSIGAEVALVRRLAAAGEHRDRDRGSPRRSTGSGQLIGPGLLRRARSRSRAARVEPSISTTTSNGTGSSVIAVVVHLAVADVAAVRAASRSSCARRPRRGRTSARRALAERLEPVALDEPRRARAAPVRTPTTSALMSPATIFGTREFATRHPVDVLDQLARGVQLDAGEDRRPPGRRRPCRCEYGSLPPMSSQCALIAV